MVLYEEWICKNTPLAIGKARGAKYLKAKVFGREVLTKQRAVADLIFCVNLLAYGFVYGIVFQAR